MSLQLTAHLGQDAITIALGRLRLFERPMTCLALASIFSFQIRSTGKFTPDIVTSLTSLRLTYVGNLGLTDDSYLKLLDIADKALPFFKDLCKLVSLKIVQPILQKKDLNVEEMPLTFVLAPYVRQFIKEHLAGEPASTITWPDHESGSGNWYDYKSRDWLWY